MWFDVLRPGRLDSGAVRECTGYHLWQSSSGGKLREKVLPLAVFSSWKLRIDIRIHALCIFAALSDMKRPTKPFQTQDAAGKTSRM